MPANTSKNKSSCKCDSNCGCCTRKQLAAESAKREPGFIGKRPWLFIVAAFIVLFAVWGTMFTLAFTHQPEQIVIKSGESAE
jgi:hypothetical protein